MNTFRLFDELVPGKEGDPNLYRICPYDKSHQIRVERFLIHVFKCRAQYVKKYGEATMRICKFNSEHHVHYTEYENHLKRCKDSYDMLRFEAAYSKPQTYNGKGERVPKKKNDNKALTYEELEGYEWEQESLKPYNKSQMLNELKKAYRLKIESQMSIVRERKQ